MSVPHKDFSDLYEQMSGKGESASEWHTIEKDIPSPMLHFDWQPGAPVGKADSRLLSRAPVRRQAGKVYVIITWVVAGVCGMLFPPSCGQACRTTVRPRRQ